jgi:hypothetical protein
MHVLILRARHVMLNNACATLSLLLLLLLLANVVAAIHVPLRVVFPTSVRDGVRTFALRIFDASCVPLYRTNHTAPWEAAPLLVGSVLADARELALACADPWQPSWARELIVFDAGVADGTDDADDVVVDALPSVSLHRNNLATDLVDCQVAVRLDWPAFAVGRWVMTPGARFEIASATSWAYVTTLADWPSSGMRFVVASAFPATSVVDVSRDLALTACGVDGDVANGGGSGSGGNNSGGSGGDGVNCEQPPSAGEGTLMLTLFALVWAAGLYSVRTGLHATHPQASALLWTVLTLCSVLCWEFAAIEAWAVCFVATTLTVLVVLPWAYMGVVLWCCRRHFRLTTTTTAGARSLVAVVVTFGTLLLCAYLARHRRQVR